VPIEYLVKEMIQNIGIGLCIIGLTFVFIAQLQMKSTWRIGLDHEQKSELVSTGLFRLSRNPIYLGLMISFVGFFLLAPNALSVCFVVIMYISLEMKIRFEEAYLDDNHTDDYKLYKQKVRRWI
jgi:protein-S-isoprenylcysteine O-methyltransferase Ste14